jgi:photosystem II stability/assembly factor-like uncharacterized protein
MPRFLPLDGLSHRFVLALAFLTITTTESSAQWIPQKSPTDARLRGLSVVNPSVAWCSGTKGTVLRTQDGGSTWRSITVPSASDLDFRDIQAFDAQTAVLLSIGEGDKSRIYKTRDGGETWKLQYQNQDPKGFLDAIGFWDEQHGLAFGDPVDGRFVILATDDAAETWTPIPAQAMPPALPAEGAFAASGTCLVVDGTANAWFATGGAKVARVFRSVDRGRTWTAHETPVIAGSASAGIFSLAFRDANHGVAVGGDYRNPDRSERTAAWTADGGITWISGEGPMEYRSGVVYRNDGLEPVVLAVGPMGTSRSKDEGRTWESLGQQGFHAVSASGGVVWAVGESGRIARFAP